MLRKFKFKRKNVVLKPSKSQQKSSSTVISNDDVDLRETPIMRVYKTHMTPKVSNKTNSGDVCQCGGVFVQHGKVESVGPFWCGPNPGIYQQFTKYKCNKCGDIREEKRTYDWSGLSNIPYDPSGTF